LPEDASSGLTPHRAAKDASLRSRSGLSAAAMSSAAALSGPMPAAGQQVGSVAGDGGGDLVFPLADLVGERQDPPGQEPQGVGGGAGGVLRCVDVQLRAATDQPQVAQPSECFPQLGIGRDEHGFRVG